MSFNWDEFSSVAELLLNDSSSKDFSGISKEGLFRIATSRIYYACFKRAFEYARDKDDNIMLMWSSFVELQKLGMNTEANNYRQAALNLSDSTSVELSKKFETQNDHEVVSKHFLEKTPASKASNHIGHGLRALRKLRNYADYMEIPEFNDDNIQAVIDWKEKIVSALDSLNTPKRK